MPNRAISKSPLLFVNVDGVLTSARTYWRDHTHVRDALDPVALQLLQKFCKETKLTVVIASVWSGFMPTAEQWRAEFKHAKLDIPVVDVLALPKNGVPCWPTLVESYMQERPGIPYALLIDDAVAKNKDWVVHVNALTGLTTVELLKVATLLVPGTRVVSELTSLNRAFKS
ncbi:MAG: HAD domain-containing protein [Agitococcus sp.]|nr:HAD domain-containing protein [Agitococcus sp.]